MRRFLGRVAGVALMAAGALGLVICIVGLFLIPRVEARVQSVVMEQLEVIDRALTNTAQGLDLAETSMAQANTVLESVADVAEGVGQAVSNTVPTLDAVSELLGEGLPATIESTQESLASAATSAELVDNVLATLTAIPLLGINRYSPDVPLHQSLEEIGTSLDEIPPSLTKAQEGLTSSRGDLQGLGEEITSMAADIGQVRANLESAGAVLVEYQTIVAESLDLVASVRASLPTWLRTLRWGLSLALIWLGMAQIGLITQGWELIGRR